MDLSQHKLEIAYPCRWEYKVIGPDQERLRQAIGSLVAGMEHTVTFSNSSRQGRYFSLRLELLVPDEQTRHRIFEELRKHPDVIMVL